MEQQRVKIEDVRAIIEKSLEFSLKAKIKTYKYIPHIFISFFYL